MIFLGIFIDKAFAMEDYTFMCTNDTIDRVILILEPTTSNAWVQTKVLMPGGTSKIYSYRTEGANFDSRASQIANDMKNCRKVRFYYDTSGRGRDTILVRRIEITLVHR